MFRFDMAVISKEPTPPGKPSDLDVRVRSDKSLEIRWAGGDGECNDYELEIRYFRLGGAMIKPDHSTVKEVKGLATHELHPENLPKDLAWVVKVGLKAKSENSFSEAIMKQVSWDDELADRERLEGKYCWPERGISILYRGKRVGVATISSSLPAVQTEISTVGRSASWQVLFCQPFVSLLQL